MFLVIGVIDVLAAERLQGLRHARVDHQLDVSKALGVDPSLQL